MVVLKTSKELSDMKLSCKISAQALRLAGELIRPGVSTAYVDKMLHEFILSQGARPTFLGYGGFPASACISINNEVIHGIPSEERIIQDGDIVSVDVGAAINGYTGDNAATFAAGRISGEAQKRSWTSQRNAFAGRSRRRSLATGWATSGTRCSPAPKATALRWSETMWDMASAGNCTKTQQSLITAPRDMASSCCRG